MTPQVGKNYTFAVFLKGVGGPVHAHLEVEPAGSPWDRAVKGANVLLPENQWTDLHVTFTCRKPFPEGWQAYVGCAQESGRFRADLFRLYEGDYVPWKSSASPAGRRTRPARRTFSSTRALRAAESPGSSCSTSSST